MLRRWQRYGEIRREPSLYTDRELDDMGIRRSDIPQIARDAAAMVQPIAAEATIAGFTKGAHS